MNPYKVKVESYVNGVLSGEIVAGRWVVSACRRYRRDLEDCEAKGWRFDEEKAIGYIEFIQSLKHTKSPWDGKPFILSPSQLFMVWNVYGFVIAETGLRRFHTAYATVARKYGKSTFLAGLSTAMLFVDDPIEVEAEGYAAATKDDQAARLVTQTYQMIAKDPVLSMACKGYKFRSAYKEICLEGEPWNGSYFKSLGQDSKTADSLNPSFVLVDELHAWTESQRELFRKLKTGGGTRAQPILWIITTAGDDKSLLWIEQDAYCQRVLETADAGECIDDGMFCFIARIDESRVCECGGTEPLCEHCHGTGEIEGDDPLDESVWQKANPDLGVTPTLKYLKQHANEATNMPSALHDFIRFNGNSMVSSTFKLIPDKLWSYCRGDIGDWSAGNSYGAVDIGTRDDLASIAACMNIDGVYCLRQKSYMPSDGARDVRKEPWASWIRAGLIEVHEGKSVQIQAIEDDIKDWVSKYGTMQWAFDPNNALFVAQRLEHVGIEIFRFPQTYAMYNEPLSDMLQALRSRQIRHDGDPVLSWAAGNVVAKVWKGQRMPDKESSQEKIDPFVAAVMAYRVACLAPDYSGGFLTV